MIKPLSFASLSLFLGTASAWADPPIRNGVVVLNATQFLQEIPAGNTFGAAGGGGRGRGGPAAAPASAPGLPSGFSFESFSINLRSEQPFSAKATLPDAGPWYLYVRSRGTATSSFKVALNGTALPDTFGDSSSFKVSGPLNLQGAVKVTLTDIRPGSSFDVMLLAKSKDLKETDLLPLQYPEDIVLLKEYNVTRPDGIKFGDLNGDGKMDLVVLTPSYSCYAYDNSGAELWHWDAPEAGTVQRSEFEAPGNVWDFDNDGKAEVLHWRNIDGKEYIVMSDGATGTVKFKAEWPNNLPAQHVYNNFRTAIAKTHPGHPDTLLVYTDSGGTVSLTAFGPRLNQLWQYSQPRLKDYDGHYIYPVDITGDGIDEIYISHVMFNARGEQLWNNFAQFPDNHDHVDSARIADLNGDGKFEIIAGQSDVGALMYDAATGKIIWQRFANHTQKVEGGFYRTDVPGPQVVMSSRYYVPSLSAHLRWFDMAGKPISIWPNIQVPSNPNFVKGDFKGDGKVQLFWYRFRIDSDGTGAMAFPDEVFHMFDFMGTGNEQVITMGRGGPLGGVVRVYGYKGAKQGPAKRDAVYMAHSVSNHTHY
jgi:hypothetical protein